MSSKPIAHERTQTHIINTIEWNSMPEFYTRGNLETSYCELKDGEVVDGSFTLIQHGWHSYEEAHSFIKKALFKGWSGDKIADVMDFIKTKKYRG